MKEPELIRIEELNKIIKKEKKLLPVITDYEERLKHYVIYMDAAIQKAKIIQSVIPIASGLPTYSMRGLFMDRYISGMTLKEIAEKKCITLHSEVAHHGRFKKAYAAIKQKYNITVVLPESEVELME